jgi:hyperosmotically inducible protein
MRAIRALLVAVLIVIVAMVAYTYWSESSLRHPRDASVGTGGQIDVNTARERGAQVGEKVAIAAEKIKESTAEAALTSKIKAKMVLDDSVKARAIDVTTSGTTVTLSGTVGSAAERERAVRLARETSGVTEVVDHLTIGR